MSSELVEMEGILVEADIDEEQPRKIAGGMAKRVQGTLDKIRPILIGVCEPVSKAWEEMKDKNIAVEQAEVQLSLGFEGSGDIYVVKGKANANLTVKMTLKPR